MFRTGEEIATGASFATLLRRLRGDLSLRELGRRASCSKSLISDLENLRRSPTPQVAESLDRALGAGGELTALASRNRSQSSHPRGTGVDSINGQDDLFQEWDDAVRRREFLFGGVVAATMLHEQTHGDGSASGGHELMSAHRDLRAAHGRLDNLRGAPAVFGPATHQHQQVLAWHGSIRSSPERRRVAALAADTGSFVGFLTYDMGMPDEAAQYYREAAEYAREAGDLSLCANILGQMSRILAERGQYRQARALTDRALGLAATTVHPAVRSWLHAVRAHHHACTGESRESQDDLSKAWTLLECAHDGEIPSYIGYLGAPELNKWTGHTMNRLSQTTPGFLRTGRTALDDARAAWPAKGFRGSAEVLTASASAYAASGDHEEASDLLTRSLAIAISTGSARNLQAALATQAGTGPLGTTVTVTPGSDATSNRDPSGTRRSSHPAQAE